MSNDTNLFEEFAPISKAEWLAKIEKDLKGKPLADLQFQLEENITLDPFYHPDDFTENYAPIVQKASNNWQIGEYIESRDVKKANAQALEALNGGANALHFNVFGILTQEDFTQLFTGIELEYISINFKQSAPDRNPSVFLEEFYNYLKTNHKNPKDIHVFLNFNNSIGDWEKRPLEELAAAIVFYNEKMPNFRLIEVNAIDFHYSITEEVSTELAYTIAQGNAYLAGLSEFDINPTISNQHLQFSLAIGTSYFIEIAKLRALKLLWANVLAAYKAPIEMPLIEVHFDRKSQGTNPNTNMIRAATQALSAVIGGADRLYIMDSNAALDEHSTAFTRRIARNVQHILQLESYMDKVIDPAAGSYYIEKLTDKLAEQAWEKFQAIEKKGGYLKL